MGQGRKKLDSGYIRVKVMVTIRWKNHETFRHCWVCRWGLCNIGYVITGVYSNNFVGQQLWQEICCLLYAILVIIIFIDCVFELEVY